MERFGITFLVAILLLLFFSGVTCANDEVEALMAFKKAITNDTNGATKDWSSDYDDVNPACTWLLLECDHNSVVQMNLQSMNLSGQLVAELGNLTNLQYMELYDNNITGYIPTELGKLTELTSFDLFKNNLDGAIPNAFDNLKKLKFFRLQMNKLTGSIPSTLTAIPLLQVLDLSSNQLTGEIPAGLADLTNLRSVNLSNNQLSGRVPEGFKNIQFVTIDVSNNPGLCGPYTNKQCS